MPTTEATEAATTTNETASATPAAAVSTQTDLLGDAAAPATTETPAAEKPAEGTKPAEPPAKVEGAPEKYEFKAPEGKGFDPGILVAFEAAARDSNLTQEAAQKLLGTMYPKIAEHQVEQVKAIREGWVEQSRADKEFGGDSLEENLGIAKKAYDTFATPELKALMGATGLSNHPEVIRMFVKVGKQLKEDTFVSGAASTRTTSLLDVLYDKTPKE